MAKRARKQPPAAIRNRLDKCRAEMKKHGISAYLITNRPDQIYLTGFDGEDGAAIITPQDVHLISDGRFDETMDKQASWARKHLRKGDLAAECAGYIKKLRLKRVAFQPDHVSFEMHAALRKACRPIKLEPAAPIVNRMRLVKDRAELGKIRQAIEIAEEAFKATRKKIKIGMTEMELAGLLEFEMKRRGAIAPSFRSIVAEGANASLPHAEPGKRTIRANSLILIDWGAISEYYCSDLTRVLFMGKVSPRFKRVYEIVLEAQMLAIASIAPGKKGCEIDAVARDYITQAGFGKQFGHGLGHGVGLDIHEGPRLKYGFADTLEPGMVVTVEPGIYLPGLGGVRIEDDVLVTSRGHEVLTKLKKSLRWACRR